MGRKIRHNPNYHKSGTMRWWCALTYAHARIHNNRVSSGRGDTQEKTSNDATPWPHDSRTSAGPCWNGWRRIWIHTLQEAWKQSGHYVWTKTHVPRNINLHESVLSVESVWSSIILVVYYSFTGWSNQLMKNIFTSLTLTTLEVGNHIGIQKYVGFKIMRYLVSYRKLDLKIATRSKMGAMSPLLLILPKFFRAKDV